MPGLSLSGCGPAEIRSSLYDKSGVVLLRRFSLIWVWFCYIFGMIYSLLSLPGSVFWSDVFANRCWLMPVCRLMPVVPVCVGWCRECRFDVGICRFRAGWCRWCRLVPVVPLGVGFVRLLRLLNRSTSLKSATFMHETGPTITDPSEVLWLLTYPPVLLNDNYTYNTVLCHYKRSRFSQTFTKIIHKIAHPLGRGMRCFVDPEFRCFVDPAFHWYSASVPVIVYVISHNVGVCYNSTWLYIEFWLFSHKNNVLSHIKFYIIKFMYLCRLTSTELLHKIHHFCHFLSRKCQLCNSFV